MIGRVCFYGSAIFFIGCVLFFLASLMGELFPEHVELFLGAGISVMILTVLILWVRFYVKVEYRGDQFYFSFQKSNKIFRHPIVIGLDDIRNYTFKFSNRFSTAVFRTKTGKCYYFYFSAQEYKKEAIEGGNAIVDFLYNCVQQHNREAGIDNTVPYKAPFLASKWFLYFIYALGAGIFCVLIIRGMHHTFSRKYFVGMLLPELAVLLQLLSKYWYTRRKSKKYQA
ncbi:hypothetical protein [Niabella hirudinis]|uniref:hypothetical protein n=1 Tax=Niabella hirudinis TaxID=1285929 RepID=UPI003EBB3B44